MPKPGQSAVNALVYPAHFLPAHSLSHPCDGMADGMVVRPRAGLEGASATLRNPLSYVGVKSGEPAETSIHQSHGG